MINPFSFLILLDFGDPLIIILAKHTSSLRVCMLMLAFSSEHRRAASQTFCVVFGVGRTFQASCV